MMQTTEINATTAAAPDTAAPVTSEPTTTPATTPVPAPQPVADQVAALHASLTEAQEALTAAKARHSIDLALLRAGVIDLEAGRLLVQSALAREPSTDPARAVEHVRRATPVLFRPLVPGSVMGPVREGDGGSPEASARRAAQTGDRRALLQYLRARRGA